MDIKILFKRLLLVNFFVVNCFAINPVPCKNGKIYHGGLCAINSSMQCLWQLPKFISYIERDKIKTSDDNKIEVKILKSTLNDIKSYNVKSESICYWNLFNALDTAQSSFVFIEKLIERLNFKQTSYAYQTNSNKSKSNLFINIVPELDLIYIKPNTIKQEEFTQKDLSIFLSKKINILTEIWNKNSNSQIKYENSFELFAIVSITDLMAKIGHNVAYVNYENNWIKVNDEQISYFKNLEYIINDIYENGGIPDVLLFKKIDNQEDLLAIAISLLDEN